MIVLRQLATATAIALALVAGAAQAQEAKGKLVIAGGEFRYDNPAWQKFVDLAGGKDAPVVVFPTASSNGPKYGKQATENLVRLGAKAELLPVALKRFDVNYKDAVKDPALVEKVRKAKGIYFIGGGQERITQVLYNEDGSPTPMLQAVWDAYKDGAVVGGSSAGAAIMSKMMFKDAMDSLDTMKFGITPGKQVDRGLGFIGDDWFVDQHFIQRGRFARSLVAMRDFGYKYGIGVDENTAVVVTNGKDAEVVGYHGAVIMDLRNATSDKNAPYFNIKGAKLSYVAAGDKIDLKTLEITPTELKKGDLVLDPKGKDFDPYVTEAKDFTFPNVLAPNG
ncbi:MAG TPA: cyanophycinase, partial [Alphaproteobacteria bacterium]|nr:cyanophycinase [Alphaproteobacteria bacterium]